VVLGHHRAKGIVAEVDMEAFGYRLAGIAHIDVAVGQTDCRGADDALGGRDQLRMGGGGIQAVMIPWEEALRAVGLFARAQAHPARTEDLVEAVEGGGDLVAIQEAFHHGETMRLVSRDVLIGDSHEGPDERLMRGSPKLLLHRSGS